MIRIILIISLLILSSCSSKKEEIKTAANSYIKAMELLDDKDFSQAAEKFEAIYDDYPLSKWSIKAGTVAVYAYYKEKRYEDVVRVSETFISLSPASEYIPYFQYMKAISYFNMIPNVDRGQNFTKDASYAFRELLARFPYSDYLEDSKKKILIIDEQLAAAKMTIARYQMARENYIGAIMYLNDVVYRYAKTNHSSEAYARLFEVYYKLGMTEKAQRVKNEMLQNHTEGYWVDYLNKISS